MKKGNPFGTHRVIQPEGALPQPAKKIDNTMEIYSNEILIDVQTLNVDSASFTQIKNACDSDETKIANMINDIVIEKGKLQNPVTGSGGMLIGTIKEIGPDFPDQSLKVGDKIATLVSLSLTPLKIDEIVKVNKGTDQVDIKGQAILFESGLYAVLPEDISEKLALAVLDVAGAPAQVDKLVKKEGPDGKVIVIEYSEENAKRIENMGIADEVIIANATKPVTICEKINDITNGDLCDVVINNVNVEETEMSSILITKDEGIVYFFSMATSFTRAALGAEGVGKDINMIIGNGYNKGHADLSLQIIRESKQIRELFEKLYI